MKTEEPKVPRGEFLKRFEDLQRQNLELLTKLVEAGHLDLPERGTSAATDGRNTNNPQEPLAVGFFRSESGIRALREIESQHRPARNLWSTSHEERKSQP
jgi:hypothetical protein